MGTILATHYDSWSRSWRKSPAIQEMLAGDFSVSQE